MIDQKTIAPTPNKAKKKTTGQPRENTSPHSITANFHRFILDSQNRN